MNEVIFGLHSRGDSLQKSQTREDFKIQVRKNWRDERVWFRFRLSKEVLFQCLVCCLVYLYTREYLESQV